jgi:hypothetical protein
VLLYTWHSLQQREDNDMTICKIEGCEKSTAGKSRYCYTHRAEARIRFRDKCEADKQEREERYEGFRQLTIQAHAAGRKAGDTCEPTPMYIKGYAPVLDGACGFAWVTVRPGNCSFAIWAKKNAGYSKAYRGGVELWISGYDQSMARKEAYARSYSQVLRDAGIEAYAGSRMD